MSRTLAPGALEVQEAAYEMAGIIDGLALTRDAMSTANGAADDLWVRLNGLIPDSEESEIALSVLRQALAADDLADLERLLNELAGLVTAGLDPTVASLWGDERGVFAVRSEQLALGDRSMSLAASFDESSAAAEASVSNLLTGSRALSSETVELGREQFRPGQAAADRDQRNQRDCGHAGGLAMGG